MCGKELAVDQKRNETNYLLFDSFETTFHVLNQRDGIEELALALGTLLNPSLVPVLFALLDAVDIVLQTGDHFCPIAVTGELSLTATTIDLPIETGVVNDGKQDRVRHPFGLFGQQCSLVRGATGVLMDSQTLLVQELEAAHLTLFDLTLCPILGTVVDAVDIVRGCWDLFEPFRSVIAGKCLITSLAVDVEREIFDHV
jgi:hypothetical protein